jgi:hypothetical protein
LGLDFGLVFGEWGEIVAVRGEAFELEQAVSAGEADTGRLLPLFGPPDPKV